MSDLNSKIGHLLIVDDDADLVEVLESSLSRRGFQVYTAGSVRDAVALLDSGMMILDFAIVDLKMPHDSGLTLISQLKQRFPDIKIVILTGFASISTSVDAIKLGATYYLSKPVRVIDILKAFDHEPAMGIPDVPDVPAGSALEKSEWELIQTTLTDCGFNISKAAEKLGIHRRTLQRKLQKRPYFG